MTFSLIFLNKPTIYYFPFPLVKLQLGKVGKLFFLITPYITLPLQDIYEKPTHSKSTTCV